MEILKINKLEPIGNINNSESPYTKNENILTPGLVDFLESNFNFNKEEINKIKPGYQQQLQIFYSNMNNMPGITPEHLKKSVEKQLLKMGIIANENIIPESKRDIMPIDYSLLPTSADEGILKIIEFVSNNENFPNQETIKKIIANHRAAYSTSLSALRDYSSSTALDKLVSRIQADTDKLIAA